jgi:hypothetical protein
MDVLDTMGTRVEEIDKQLGVIHKGCQGKIDVF